MMETAYASMLLAKYAGSSCSRTPGQQPLHAPPERLNVYTDPQRAMKTEQKIYEIQQPGPESPILATSNSPLT